MKDIFKRSISGFVFVVVMVGSIFLGQSFFYVVMGVIAGSTLLEFHKNFGLYKTAKSNRGILVAKIAIGLACYVVLAAPFYHYGLNVASYELGTVSFLLIMFFMILMFVIELFWGDGDIVKSVGLDVMGIIYVIVPFSLLSYIANPSTFIWGFDRFMLLAFFCIIWGNDTFAYLTGITMGRHKMFERVSPKKSWEGFLGGVVFSLLIGWIFSLFTEFLSEYNWIWFSLVISVSSVLGDFFESLLKRNVGIKDSGSIIPGHGGLLDRFDAMLFASPMIALLLFIVTNIAN